MAINLWGAAFALKASPLYEFESLKEESIPTLPPIDKILAEGNCVMVTERGEEACECAVKLTIAVARTVSTITEPDSPTARRRQPHSRQSCEATNRNLIQGGCGQASGPTTTKPFSNRLLWFGSSVRRFRRSGWLAPPPREDVLLEAVALPSHEDSQAMRTWRESGHGVSLDMA